MRTIAYIFRGFIAMMFLKINLTVFAQKSLIKVKSGNAVLEFKDDTPENNLPKIELISVNGNLIRQKPNGKGTSFNNKSGYFDCANDNWGFENGTTSGWTASGDVNIVSGGTDPYGGYSWVYPNGGNFSVKLEDDLNAGTATLQRSINVPPSGTTYFSFHFAMSIFNFPHQSWQAAKFYVEFFDQNGNQIPCPYFECYYSTDNGAVGVQSFQQTPNGADSYNPNQNGDGNYPVTYTDWNDIVLDISGYAGQTITVRFRAKWCVYNADWAYALIDVDCPITNNTPVTECVSFPHTICGPNGMATYTWYDANNNPLGNTQCINITQEGIYYCDVLPNNIQCSQGSVITFLYEMKELPSPDFNVIKYCQDSVVFSNLSTCPSGSNCLYNWDFGDNTGTSSQQNPVYTYTNSGTYNVQLTVNASNGCSKDTVIPVWIAPLPVANFSINNVCLYDNIQPQDLSVPMTNAIVNWYWDFGDGTNSNLQNPSHSYFNSPNNFGVYPVTLTVTNDQGCKDDTTINVVIHPIPVADFSAQNICSYETAIFGDLSTIPAGNIANWYWDFGDGNTDTQQNTSHNYGINNYGFYNVQLKVVSDSGCADSVTHNIYVSPQPVADFTVADDCRDVPAQFTDQSTVASPHSIVGWNWDFGVNPPAGSTQQNPSYLYPNNGTFNVTLIVTSDSGCTDTITKPTVRYAVPVANFSFTEVCEYDSAIFASTSTINNPGVITQFIWNFGDGSPLVNIQNPKHKYSQCGPYNVTLIVSSANGCVDDTTRTINIHDQPLADFIADTVCVNGPVTSFTDLSTVQCGDVVNGWQWDFNPGMSNLQNPVHDYNQDGYFPVTLIATSSFGCKDTVTKNIRVYEKPQAAFTADTTAYCHPYCTQFTDISTSASTGIVSWDWNFYNGETSQSAMPMICFENESAVMPKYYDVRLIVSNGYGCYDTIVKKNFITVWPKPLADFTFGPQPTDIYESEIDFDNLSIGGDYFTWNFGDGNMSNLIEPMHLYADSGNYLVTLYIENDWGCSDTVSKPLRIEPDFAVFIPNAFTPDGDGDNETFFLKGYGIVEDDFQFMIFNRWGDMIYYTEKFEPWDGKVDGKLAPQGVYIYRIILKDIFDVKHEYIGNVNLIR